jgi:very-short-patch-repair endonuclease
MKKQTKKTEAELVFAIHLRELGFAKCATEYEFHEGRGWRFDYAIPSRRIAIEIEGGIWTAGRHTRGRGYQDDLDKYNSAIVRGWKVFRFSVEDVVSGKAQDCLRQFLERWTGHALPYAQASR